MGLGEPKVERGAGNHDGGGVWMTSDFWAEQAGQQGDVLQDMGKEPALP